MDPSTPSYWATAAPVRPPSRLAVPPPRPPRGPGRRGSLLALVVAVVVVLVGAAGAVVVRASRVEALSAPREVTRPAGAADGWGPSWVDGRGRPVGWDPCTPIHYVVDPAWAPASGRQDLAEALRRLSAASGLELVDDGDTDEVPSRERAAYQPQRYGDRWAPVLIAWVPPSATDLGLGAGIQGLTSTVAVPSAQGGSLVTAEVGLDADHRLAGGFGPGTTEGEVLLHELAHVVGLRHVDDPTQVMYYRTTNSESEYGAGDRAGLRALGAGGACRPAPRARQLALG